MRQLPPPMFVTYSLQTKPNYGVYDFNTNNHKRPRIAINKFMPHETQKAFTINSWIINGISCLENDIATQRLHRGGYLSHTNLTQEYLLCSRLRRRRELKQPISPQVLSSPRWEHLFSAKGSTRLRGEKYSSSRRKRISPHATGQCPESSTQYSRHLLKQSPRWE